MPAPSPNSCPADGLDVLLQMTAFAPTAAQEWPAAEMSLANLPELRWAGSLQLGCCSGVASLLQGSVAL